MKFYWSSERTNDRFGTSSLYHYSTKYRIPAIVSIGPIDVLDTIESSVFAQQRPALSNEKSDILTCVKVPYINQRNTL